MILTISRSHKRVGRAVYAYICVVFYAASRRRGDAVFSGFEKCDAASQRFCGETSRRPTKLSGLSYWPAFLLLLEAAPVDAEMAHLVVHDAAGRAEKAGGLRAVAPRGLERILDQILLVRVDGIFH